MNEYTASNGMVVRRDHNEDVNVIDRESGGLSVFMADGIALALREFFQHERDEELGRWRWPENPHFVVYPTNVPDRVRVVRENGLGDLEWVDRGDARSYEFCHAARAYFEAHPERKPWEDAKPGEVWEITFSEEGGGGPDAWIVHRSMTFRNPEFVSKVPLDDPEIKSARRIWPEGDES